MTFSTQFVADKLESIGGYVVEFSEILSSKHDEELTACSSELHAIEWLVQLIVDSMLDVNQHFIRELHLELSDELRGAFRILGDHAILPKTLRRKLHS